MRLLPVLACVIGLSSAAAAKEPIEYTLDNGLMVRLLVAPELKDAVVLLGVRAGFVEEQAGAPHVAHITEHLTVFDLPEKSAVAANRWFTTGKANGETMAGTMYFDLVVAPEELPLALRVQADRLRAPTFSRTTLTREVPRALSEVDFVEKSGFTHRFALAPFIQKAVHGRDATALRKLTRELTLEQAAAFHRRTFRPDTATLIVIGNFDARTVRKQIEADFAGIPRPKEKASSRPALKAGTLKARWDVNSRHLLLAYNIPSAQHEDHPALAVAGVLLLQRLTDARTQVVSEVDQMLFINTTLAPGKDFADEQRRLVQAVERLSQKGGFADLEVSFGRTVLLSRFQPLDPDKIKAPGVPRHLLLANGEIQRFALSSAWGDLTAYAKRLNAVTPDQVRAAIGRYLGGGEACCVWLDVDEDK